MRNDLLGHHFDFRFRRLVVSHAFDNIGNTLVAISLAGTLFFAIPTGEARGRVLLYLLFTVAPFAIVSTLLGSLLDRGVAFRRGAVVVAGFGRALLCWLMATRTGSLLLFPLALGLLVGQRLYSITRAALVPTCVPPEEPLVTANSFLVRTGAVAGFFTALVGIMIERLFSASAVLRVAAFVFIAMGLAAFLLPAPRRVGRRPSRFGDAVAAEPEPEPEHIDPTRTSMLRPGFRAIASLRALSGFLLFLLAFNLRTRGAGASGFGTLLLGIGIGALVSSLAAPVLNRWVREDILVFSCFLGAGLTTAVVAGMYSTAAAAVLAAVVGAAFGIAKLSFDSMAQRGLRRDVQGRLFARWETWFQLAWVGGAALPAAADLPVGPWLVIAGLATVVGSVFYAIDTSRVRRVTLARATPPSSSDDLPRLF